MSRISPEQQNYNLIGSRLSIMRSEIAHARNRRPKDKWERERNNAWIAVNNHIDKYNLNQPQRAELLQQYRLAGIRHDEHIKSDVTCVIVSKDIYPEMIHKAYEEGHRHFAEYSIPELTTKSNCGLIKELCPEIKWHFIGSLQTTRIGRLASVNNIYMVHTIERPVDGDILESALRRNNSTEPLYVTVQVNTSRESGANGVLPEDADRLFSHLLRFCPHLKVKGLMTVGSNKLEQRGDFITLTHLREVLQKQFSVTLDVVMGWSKDFKQAIQLGSNYVRMEERVFRPAEKKYPPIKQQLV